MKTKYSFTRMGLKPFVLALALVCPQLMKAADIDIRNSFPDEKVQELLSTNTYDWNNDGKLSDEEQANITYLDLSLQGIDDLTGIDLLTSLTYLDVRDNNITTLNLSKLVKLQTLIAYQNQYLYSVTLSGLTALQSIELSSCSLTSVNLSNLPSLQNLMLGYNYTLTQLDVSKLSELTTLDVSATGLKSIDVSGLTKLSSFIVTDCPDLETITAKGCTNLSSLHSIDNTTFPALKKLTITNCTALTYIYIECIQIESVDLTGCTELTYISVENKPQLTSLTLDGCSKLTSIDAYNNESFTTFSATGLDKLESLYLNNCALTSVDLSNLPSLTTLYVYDNTTLTTLDVSKLSELASLNASNTGLKSINVNGLTKLTNLDVTKCNDLTMITARGCTSLGSFNSLDNESYPALKTLTLTGCTALTYMYVYCNQIESIDLTGCTELTYFYAVDRPKLIMLKLDGCSKLATVEAYSNGNLATFSATGLDKLENLSLNGCALTSINLSNLPSLQTLNVNDNPTLTKLDLSKLSELVSLNAYNTGLTEINADGLTKLYSISAYDCNNLATISAKGCTSFSGLGNFDDSFYPALKSLTITGSTALNGFSTYGQKLESLDLSGCTNVNYLYVNDRPMLTSLTLDGSEIQGLYIYGNAVLTSLDLSTANIENLQIYNHPLLETVKLGSTQTLNITDNEKLSTIDVTALKGVKNVSIYNNPALTALDLSSLNELEEVSVQNNNLETLLVNSPVLTRLYCFNNKLTTLDVSGLTALTYLDCSNNLLPSLDVTKNTKLEQLSCSHNRLTSLDLSKNTKLNYAYTYQYVENELVKISAKEVGLAVDNSFDPANIEEGSFQVAGFQKEPKYVFVDGVRYLLVHDNAATVETELQNQNIYYSYKTGHADYPLYINLTITSFTKVPSFLKVAPESVKGTFGAALAAPTLTRSQDYNGTVTYASADQNVVKVASDGKLTVTGAGTTTVTLTGVETEYRLAPAAITYGVTIEKASPVFKFASATQEMNITDAVPANALDKGVYDGKVVYASSDEKVAKIDANGKITIIAAGEVTFTASGEATNNCNAPTSASYKLTIKKLTATLSVASASIEGVYGSTLTAPALTLNGYDGTPTYKSSDEKVVKVAADGKLTVIGAGEATITISGAATAKYYAPADVTYKVKIAKAEPQFAFANAEVAAIVTGAVPENKLNKGIYDGKVVYSTSNAAIADVNADTGAVTMKKAGEVTITATGAETSNCKGSTATYKLTLSYLKGDLNQDGVVDAKDVLEITNALAGNPSEKYDKNYADLNKDKKVDIADVILLVNEIDK